MLKEPSFHFILAPDLNYVSIAVPELREFTLRFKYTSPTANYLITSLLEVISNAKAIS